MNITPKDDGLLHLAGMALWTRDAGSEPLPAAAMLNPRARGRASLLTLMFAEVVGQAAAEAEFEHGSFATVYGSSFGEMERLIELLHSMQGSASEVSPLRFQTSVHNAAAGQISIASKNTAFSTSIAAGNNTVAMGFVEAVAWMKTYAQPLVLALGDEAPPARLHPGEPYAPIAAAFAFVPPSEARPEHARLQVHLNEAGGPPRAGLVHNPCAVLQPLTAWLAAGSVGVFSLSGAAGSAYCIERL
ncbi:MAG: beta-ketoacyl synthase chain length factor [Deltaproteobacteria bacterium]|nr:beta-ketoacyl synthase chain length factor [Deltaproteobacteria bacterium]